MILRNTEVRSMSRQLPRKEKEAEIGIVPNSPIFPDEWRSRSAHAGHAKGGFHQQKQGKCSGDEKNLLAQPPNKIHFVSLAESMPSIELKPGRAYEIHALYTASASAYLASAAYQIGKRFICGATHGRGKLLLCARPA